AGPNTQIVILLSGHGTQIPIPESQTDPLDPKNPEPDGLDEVFLPSDAELWDNGTMKRIVKDDHLGEWLDQMRDRGADVWLLCDCCHSGTMSRGEEVSRTTTPEQMRIPQDALDRAVKRGREAVEKAQKEGKDVAAIETGALGLQPKKGRGSLVAF